MTLTRADADHPPFRVREPEDMITLVPYLLGFHPEDSVVLVLLSGGELVCTARVDFPTDPPPGALADQVDQLRARVGADRVVVLGYGRDGTGRSVLEDFAEGAGPEVVEALWVEPTRWWGLLCPGPCCPPEGHPYDAGAHPMAAEAVFAGLAAEGDRASVAALAVGPPTDRQPALERRAARALARLRSVPLRTRQRRIQRLVGLLTPSAEPPDPAQALQLGALARDVHVRDVAYALMSRADADQHRALWSTVVHQVPDSLASAPLCLLGVAGWLSGNGALLNCCIERLDVLDPSYSMAELCRDISDRAVPPRVWDDLAVALRTDLGLVVP